MEYHELIKQIAHRPKMTSTEYWNLVIDNANVIFRESLEQPKHKIAEELGLSQPVFSTVLKIVTARFMKD